MSAITLSKTKARGYAAASPRVERGSLVQPISLTTAVTPTPVQTKKKQRRHTHIIESVQEVVQAFQLEYDQVNNTARERKRWKEAHPLVCERCDVMRALSCLFCSVAAVLQQAAA